MLPDRIESVDALERCLSEPPGYVIEALSKTDGDVIVLGVAGKMGPTLARMVKRASDAAGSKRRIIGAARFSNPAEQASLRAHGIETIQCDLLSPGALEALPECANAIYMAGMKFGSTRNESLTWAMNTLLPAMVCKRYLNSRIVAFSTGNVYGLTPIGRGGSVETDPLNPQGEYAMSCVGRERMIEYFSRSNGVATSIIRLNYACELRYGVLVDLAQKIVKGESVDLSMPAFNVIWQADANALAIASLPLAASPPFVLNVAGPETSSVRIASEQLAGAMDRQVTFTGTPAADALLNNAQKSYRLFGPPSVSCEQMIGWVADWVSRGGATLKKPTHFEARDGRF